jgi:signal transduction histidine kinase
MKKRLWLWVTLFILGTGLVATLATSWNFVLVEHAFEQKFARVPWLGVILGTLGFAAILGVTILFFLRLLKEMRLNQMQIDFLAKVSHELRTPIATLELSSSLLKAGNLSDEQRTRLWASHEADLARLKREVESLLDAARWQSGARPLSFRPVVLEDWLREAEAQWREVLGAGGTVERIGKFPRKSVRIDPEMFKLITDNLVDNARKYAMGAPRLEIHVADIPPRRKGLSGSWRIEFRDHGWGFESRGSRRIFRRFVRGTTSAPYAIPGTGLGLFLAKLACRAQGIRLSAHSDGPRKGASFTLEGSWIEI